MGIFNKNPNEMNYQGGRKHWTDVIKNTGPEGQLVWKQPEEDFNTSSTLIVMPGEKAFFVNRGVIEEKFSEGTYKLSTQNYPFISRLRNLFSGGISVFNCVIYFIRDSHSSEILWGTDTPIQVRDPLYHIQTHIQARGAYRVSISDPELFLKKLMGSIRTCTSQEDLDLYFASEFQQYIRSDISSMVVRSGQDVLTICASQVQLAEEIKKKLARTMISYGLNLESFTITAIEIPEDDPNRRTLEEAMAQNVKMNMMGNNWDKVKQYEMMGKALDQVGMSGSGMAGLGMEIGIGNAMAENVGRVINQTLQSQSNPPAQEDETASRLRKLKKLLDEGLISQERYNAKVEEILSDI